MNLDEFVAAAGQARSKQDKIGQWLDARPEVLDEVRGYAGKTSSRVIHAYLAAEHDFPFPYSSFYGAMDRLGIAK